MGASIWRAEASTYNSFLGSCILSGIVAGPAETIQPVVVADVLFLHERGLHMTLYFALFFGAQAIAIIVSGLITFHSTWQNFWWLAAGLQGLSIILLLFGFPETKFNRTTIPSVVLVSPDEKAAPQETEVVTELYPCLHKGRPQRYQYPIIRWPKLSSEPLLKMLVHHFLIPFRLFFNPIAQFASLVVCFSASNILYTNITQSPVFSAAPYNFTSEQIGFTNFAVLVGQIIGVLTAGPFSDWIAMKLTVRNNGIREAEMRLVALIPYTIILVLGDMMIGFGAQYKWPWEAVLIVGYSCAGMQIAAIPGIVASYFVDSYRPIAGSVFVSATIYKNVYGYGVTKCKSTPSKTYLYANGSAFRSSPVHCFGRLHCTSDDDHWHQSCFYWMRHSTFLLWETHKTTYQKQRLPSDIVYLYLCRKQIHQTDG